MTDYLQRAADYQAGILSGKIPVCQWVRRACERNRRDLDRQGTSGFPFRFDPDKAVRICKMAEMLPHTKGPKAYVIGQDEDGRSIWNPITLEPWQCWIFTTLFGWVHQETGLRRFRTGLILVPRKNGKSIMGAIIALYMLVLDKESGAEVYSAATSRDQAKVVAEIVWEMVRRSPQFRDQFGVKLGSHTTLSLSVPATGSKFMPLSAEANSLDGLNVSCAIVDELHAHKKRDVWDVLDTATSARAQPLLLAITTAGVEIGGICHERLGYLEQILDGVVQDESCFGTNYTIDANDDYWLPEIAVKANPNLGVSVDPEDIARKMLAARHSPGALNDKLTKHFNVWVRTESGWMTSEVWQTCTNAWLQLASFKQRLESLKQYPCWIGIDLGEVRDFSAILLVFKRDAEQYTILAQIYIPQAGIDHSPIAQMSGWGIEHHVIITPGTEADYSRIKADLLGFVKTLDVRELDFDRRSARLMMQDIREALEPSLGRDRAQAFVIDVPQSVDVMDPAMKMLERLVVAKKLQHDGNPAMAWMVSNIVVERNYKDEIYPRKAGGKDSESKIDGPVALFTALSRAMAPEPERTFQVFFAGGGARP